MPKRPSSRIAISSTIVAALSLSLFHDALANELNNPNANQIGMLYRNLAGETPDFYKMAVESTVYQKAGEFDRERVREAEERRLQEEFLRYKTISSVSMRVSTQMSEYNSSIGGFVIALFQPGTYINFNNYGVIFDNYMDFANWSVPIGEAKRIVSLYPSYENGSRRITVEVVARPTGIDFSGKHQVRMFAEKIRIFKGDGLLIGELSAKSKPTEAAEANQVPVNNDVLGLKIGASLRDFEAWAAKNGFIYKYENRHKQFFSGKENISSTQTHVYYPPNSGQPVEETGPELFKRMVGSTDYVFFAKSRESIDFSEKIMNSMQYARTSSDPKTIRGFEVMGPLDCGTSVENDQQCGRVDFRLLDSGDVAVAGITFGQSIWSGDIQAVKTALKEKFGAPLAELDVSNNDEALYGKRLRQMTWGKSGPVKQDDSNYACKSIGNLTKKWEVEGILYQESGSKIFLITQICGATPSSSRPDAARSAPKL